MRCKFRFQKIRKIVTINEKKIFLKMDTFIQKYVEENFGFSLRPTPSLLKEIRDYQHINHVYIILDDDPTGTQTVHDINVYTSWSIKTLKELFKENSEMAFILTNSRALPQTEAEKLSIEIGANLKKASQESGKSFTVVSRGDSTLRGHFPAEVDSLLDEIGASEAIKLIVPAFFPGGRYTFNDIHYVKEKDQLIPVAETPFAQDKSFGFVSSNLRDWVKEKYGDSNKEILVTSISLEQIRNGTWLDLKNFIDNLAPGTICIINALTDSDLEPIVLATQLSLKPIFFRTAASLVPLLIGQEAKTLLTADDFKTSDNKGNLVVVGSYVPKSTSQLSYLRENANINEVELNVDLLFEYSKKAYIKKLINVLEKFISNDEDVLFYTSRSLRFGTNQIENLAIGKVISDALVNIVKGLKTKPKNIIAKGGITSSDIATKALKIKKARVLGQILPGVPVWETEEKIKYIVFPGNVGEEDALYQAYQKL